MKKLAFVSFALFAAAAAEWAFYRNTYGPATIAIICVADGPTAVYITYSLPKVLAAAAVISAVILTAAALYKRRR